SRRSPDSGYEDDMRWSERNYGRRARRRRSGIRLRDALLAGCASIAVGAAAGSIVYDRANDGVLSSVAFDVVGDFMTGLKIDDNAFASVARPTLVDPQEAETV